MPCVLIAEFDPLAIGLHGPALAARAFATIPLITSGNRLVGAMSALDLQPQTLTAAARSAVASRPH